MFIKNSPDNMTVLLWIKCHRKYQDRCYFMTGDLSDIWEVSPQPLKSFKACVTLPGADILFHFKASWSDEDRVIVRLCQNYSL